MPEFFAWWSGQTIQLSPQPDTTSVIRARPYCPTCDPDVDPIMECVVVDYCKDHTPSIRGQIEIILPPSTYDTAGGDSNRAACAFFHRRD